MRKVLKRILLVPGESFTLVLSRRSLFLSCVSAHAFCKEEKGAVLSFWHASAPREKTARLEAAIIPETAKKQSEREQPRVVPFDAKAEVGACAMKLPKQEQDGEGCINTRGGNSLYSDDRDDPRIF